MNAISRNWQIVRDTLADEKARQARVFRTDQTDFLPAALEIIETPVSPTGRVTAWLLIIGLAVTIAWLTFGKVDVVASANGKLIPADSVKLIQPADSGVVRAILVHDGQRVRAGQPLIQLDPTISTAEAEQAKKALETSELDAARSRAVLSALEPVERGAGVRRLGQPEAARRHVRATMAAKVDGQRRIATIGQPGGIARHCRAGGVDAMQQQHARRALATSRSERRGDPDAVARAQDKVAGRRNGGWDRGRPATGHHRSDRPDDGGG